MKFGHMFVQLMMKISSWFETELSRQETSFRPFHDSDKKAL